MPVFPFSAIVGQDPLKRALVLGVIQPGLGGVLIRGTKGVAKSTAVRSLAALLPSIDTVAGCPFQRHPGEDIPGWPLPPVAPTVRRPVPLVELPVGATEDRVLGALHLEKALRGERAFEPGLLAGANRGILYIDEVNLLPDHLVDILLDAAAGGVHRLEREGLSLSHPARFLLVGTMNPEEGELRPQLLDRFGLAVDVSDLADPSDRAEAVRRRLAFETDPACFAVSWQAADAAESERVVLARQLLPRVRIPDAVLRAVSERCLAAGAEGLRADLTLCQAARAWAAYQQRELVEPADVDLVAELALVHRRTRPPQPPSGGNGPSKDSDRGSNVEGPQSQVDQRATTAKCTSPAGSPEPRSCEILDPRSSIFEAAGLFAARLQPPAATVVRSAMDGRWRAGRSRARVRAHGSIRAYEAGDQLSWAATLRAAALRGGETNGRVVLRRDDLRAWPRRGPSGCLLLFVVDASGSMAARRRMRQTKAAVLALLVQAYQRRDRVALLAFRGRGAELVLPPAPGLESARRALEGLAVGGTTPLAHGLAAACRFVRDRRRRQPAWVVLLTDGRTNVALRAGADPWRDALGQGRALAACGAQAVVVDTETGWPRFGRAAPLARAMGAACVPLEEVLGRPLADPRRRAV